MKIDDIVEITGGTFGGMNVVGLVTVIHGDQAIVKLPENLGSIPLKEDEVKVIGHIHKVPSGEA